MLSFVSGESLTSLNGLFVEWNPLWYCILHMHVKDSIINIMQRRNDRHTGNFRAVKRVFLNKRKENVLCTEKLLTIQT